MLMYAHSIWSEAMKSLRRNLIRTVLTILSLVVGIAAFICVVGVGKAGSAKVEEQLQKLGDNMIWIEAGSRATNGVRFGTRETNSLTVEDAQAIFAEIPGFKRHESQRRWSSSSCLWNAKLEHHLSWRCSRVFRHSQVGDSERARFSPTMMWIGTCLSAYWVRPSSQNLFPNEDPVGKSIRVQAMPCRVIGIFQPKGASASGWDQDDFVAMPYTTAMKRISGHKLAGRHLLLRNLPRGHPDCDQTGCRAVARAPSPASRRAR